MSDYDPAKWPTYGAYLRAKNLQVRPGWTWRTRDQVAEGRRSDGTRFQRRRDQLGHDTVEHADGRRDVTINLGV